MRRLDLANTKSIALLGDTHGSYTAIEDAVRKAKKKDTNVIVQCGDLGFWSHTQAGMDFLDYVDALLRREDCWLLWIKGNHENHELLLTSVYNGERYPNRLCEVRDRIWNIPNGYFFSIGNTSFLACGGSVSVDQSQRTLGVSWWPEEIITMADYYECTRSEIIEAGGVDVLLSHDAPNIPLHVLLGGVGFQLHPKMSEHCESQRDILQAICDAVNPEFNFHGHYHHYHDTTIPSGLRVIGLAHEQHPRSNMGLFDTMNRQYTKLR
jgi:predicted phosphodiesterase